MFDQQRSRLFRNEDVLVGADSGDHSTVDPPVPIPNTEVKRCSADGSAAIGRVRVGRCQVFISPLRDRKNPSRSRDGFFIALVLAERSGYRSFG